MSKNLNYWKNFWSNQSTPLHRYNTPEWYERYSREINLILESSGYQGGATLETGCGNGALFNSLNINKLDYVGTDISDTLLNIFRSNHPELKLICTDSATYKESRNFELIFSNGVVQYFDRQQLQIYMRNSLEMLQPGGTLLLGNLLWRDLKSGLFGSGELSGHTQKHSMLTTTKFYVSELIGRQTMGHWHAPRDFFGYCDDNIQMQIFGSLFHAYRFSLVFKKIK
jgi:cyclopropane fatty-acyl-phospholipid synthase-like methyltransferase